MPTIILLNRFQDVQLLEAIETRLKKGRLKEEEADFNANCFDSLFNTNKALEELTRLFEGCNLEYFDKKNNIFNAGNVPRYLYWVQ